MSAFLRRPCSTHGLQSSYPERLLGAGTRETVEMPDPEALARIDIDRQLEAAGWIVQDRHQLNIHAGSGIAVREVSIPGVDDDNYLLVRPVCILTALRLAAKRGGQ